MKKRMRITKGGQVSIPAAIRRRWGTDEVVLSDEGGRIVIEPELAGAVDRAAGAFRSYFEGVDLAEERRQMRDEEREREEARIAALERRGGE